MTNTSSKLDIDSMLHSVPDNQQDAQLDNLEQDVWQNVRRSQRRLHRTGLLMHAIILINIGILSFLVASNTNQTDAKKQSFVQSLSGDHGFAVWEDS